MCNSNIIVPNISWNCFDYLLMNSAVVICISFVCPFTGLCTLKLLTNVNLRQLCALWMHHHCIGPVFWRAAANCIPAHLHFFRWCLFLSVDRHSSSDSWQYCRSSMLRMLKMYLVWVSFIVMDRYLVIAVFKRFNLLLFQPFELRPLEGIWNF